MEDFTPVDSPDADHLFGSQIGGVDVGQPGGDVVEDVGWGLIQLVDFLLEDPPVGHREQSVRHGHYCQVHLFALTHCLHLLGPGGDSYRHWDTRQQNETFFLLFLLARECRCTERS